MLLRRGAARQYRAMSRRRDQKPRLRIFGEYCCVWPVWGEGGEEVEQQVSAGLRQNLLDWQAFWQDHKNIEGWDTPESAEEYRSRGRGLQHRLQRELDEPVEFGW